MKSAKITVIVLSALVGLVMIAAGAFNIYQNSKTDGFGGGWIKVSKCSEVDWSWRVYQCNGEYTASAGMISVDNITVKVRGEYKAGETIADVYPTSYKLVDSDTIPQTFVTGFERISVVYNLVWILMVVIGFLLPIFTIIFALFERPHRRKKS